MKKYFSKLKIGLILIDLNQIFPMKPSKFEIFFSVESYDTKTAETCRNCYGAEERIVSKLSKVSMPSLNRTN